MSTLKVSAINNAAAGSGGLVLAADGNVSGAGMDLITTSTFSAASSVSVDGCFTSSYDDYLLLVTLVGSATTNGNFRFRAGASDNSSANYYRQYLDGNNAAVSANRLTAQTAANNFSVATNGVSISFNIYSPAIATATMLTGYVMANITTPGITAYAVGHNVATAYDGFTIYPSSGTITGTLRVYGYRN